MLWGDAAIAKYSHRPTDSKSRLPQLSKIPKTSEVLGLVDTATMVETCSSFPLDLVGCHLQPPKLLREWPVCLNNVAFYFHHKLYHFMPS